MAGTEDRKNCNSCDGNDLSDYITQVNYDIGRSFNKELFLTKIVKASSNSRFGFRKSKRECKMASATNPLGISSEEYGKFAIHVYQYLHYIKGLEVPTLEELKESNKLVTINRLKENKRLLVFDLDETLVHCIHNDKNIQEADLYLDIQLPNGTITKAGFNIRPYWKEMMDEIKDDWEVVVFTASCKNYANAIVNFLDPDGIYFPHRFYRENCWLTPEGVYIKDLRIFHQWNLKDIILVDNAVYSFGFQLDNGIPIFPYSQGKDDMQLLYLKEYLKSIASKEIIPDLKKTFQMSNLYHMDLDKLLDYYEEENSSEDANDILDEMFSFSTNRTRATSFQDPMLIQYGRLSIAEDTPEVIEHQRNSDILATVSNHMPRTYSGSIQEKQEAFLGDNQPSDSDVGGSNFEMKELESKPKLKRRKTRLGKLKKVYSTYIRQSDKDDQLPIVECETPCKVIEESSKLETKFSRGNNTPKRTRCVKKIKKKKGTKVSKDKVDSNDYNDYEDDKKEYTHQISLFAKKRSKEEVEDPSSDSSSKEEQDNDFIFRGNSSEIHNPIPNQNNFSRSAESKSNRHLSLLNPDKFQSLYDVINDQQNKKRASTSSSSSDEIFERDNDSKLPTNWSSLAQNSHVSSNDLNHGANQNGIFVSPFADVIEEETESKDSSPLLPRRDKRRSSLNDELDIIYQYNIRGGATN